MRGVLCAVVLSALGFAGCGSAGTPRVPVSPADSEYFSVKVAAKTARPFRVGIDRNGELGRLLRMSGTCTVGPSELDCLTKVQRDGLGNRETTLDLGKSAQPSADISREITAEDGSVIYRASLNEHGNGRPTANATAGLAIPASARER